MRRFFVGAVVGTFVVAAVACAHGDGTPGVAGPRFAVVDDTVTGVGSVAELQLQLDQWRSSRPANYRFDLSVSCFCGGDINRPARVYVRGDAVVRVVALDDGALLDTRQFPTIDKIFEHALTVAANGGPVRGITYVRTTGQILHATVGTPENDAGSFYNLGVATGEP